MSQQLFLPFDKVRKNFRPDSKIEMSLFCHCTVLDWAIEMSSHEFLDFWPNCKLFSLFFKLYWPIYWVGFSNHFYSNYQQAVKTRNWDELYSGISLFNGKCFFILKVPLFIFHFEIDPSFFCFFSFCTLFVN